MSNLRTSKLLTKRPSIIQYIPNHQLLDRSPNIGPLISRWELDKFKNCQSKSFRTSKILTLLYQQFSNLLISKRDMSGPRLGALSTDRTVLATVCTNFDLLLVRPGRSTAMKFDISISQGVDISQAGTTSGGAGGPSHAATTNTAAAGTWYSASPTASSPSRTHQAAGTSWRPRSVPNAVAQ